MMQMLIDGELAASGDVDDEGVFHVTETHNGWWLKSTFTYDEARALVGENPGSVVWRG